MKNHGIREAYEIEIDILNIYYGDEILLGSNQKALVYRMPSAFDALGPTPDEKIRYADYFYCLIKIDADGRLSLMQRNLATRMGRF